MNTTIDSGWLLYLAGYGTPSRYPHVRRAVLALVEQAEAADDPEPALKVAWRLIGECYTTEGVAS